MRPESSQIKISFLSQAMRQRASKVIVPHESLDPIAGVRASGRGTLLIGWPKVFAADPQAQGELVAARCMDAHVGPGSELVVISVKKAGPPTSGVRPPASPEFPYVELSHETERAFAWLRSQCPLNPDLEKHLVGYARLTGMK